MRVCVESMTVSFDAGSSVNREDCVRSCVCVHCMCVCACVVSTTVSFDANSSVNREDCVRGCVCVCIVCVCARVCGVHDCVF